MPFLCKQQAQCQNMCCRGRDAGRVCILKEYYRADIKHSLCGHTHHVLHPSVDGKESPGRYVCPLYSHTVYREHGKQYISTQLYINACTSVHHRTIHFYLYVLQCISLNYTFILWTHWTALPFWDYGSWTLYSFTEHRLWKTISACTFHKRAVTTTWH